MQLVEKHVINKNHKYYKELDNLCFLSKNLYNVVNYLIRQEFIKTNKYLNYNEIDKILNSSNNKDYYNLPCKVSQQILKLLDKNYKSFFKANRLYKLHPEKFKGRPKLPNYKHKVKGRNILVYTIQAISKKELINNIIKLSKTDIKIKTKINIKLINQIRIIPKNSNYIIEVVYTVQEKQKIENDKAIAVDLGLNNLATVVNSVDVEKLIVNGKPLKSMNQYYNKKKAKLQSKLKNKFTSNKIEKITNKRNNKITDYLHKASRKVINYCLTKDVSKIIIGYNKLWKQNISIGKRNNQNFVNLPFYRFISMLEYKGKLEGIEIILHEESYTSKCSFVDDEEICKHESYLGKRIKRGLFQSKEKIYYNADINGALNIMRKVVPTFSVRDYGVEGVVVHPVKCTIGFN